MSEVLNVEKLFGENVFTLGKMQERLPKKAFAEVKRVMEHGGELDNATADVVAKTMKDWAVEHGATHYTHWFQPLTGITARRFLYDVHQPFRFLQNSGYCPQNQNKGSRSGKKRAALFSTGCPAQKNVLARGFFMQCIFNSDVAVHLGDGI